MERETEEGTLKFAGGVFWLALAALDLLAAILRENRFLLLLASVSVVTERNDIKK